jgi:transposase
VDEDKGAEEIAGLAQGKLKQKRSEIAEAVRGHCLSPIQKELIRSSIRHMALLELEIRELDALIGGLIKSSRSKSLINYCGPFRGSGWRRRPIFWRKTGPDMKPFPDAAHMSSWGGICPGDNESAGRHKDRHTTKGNPWYRATLMGQRIYS